ncbi:MAG: hypothetical protein HC819_08935 [Cyclobacteriaceae bacterium]|nr:hypothetical protein [Cyclobacteriaceae bacterium]
MSEKYKVRDQDKLHFNTFAMVYWLDLFTRVEYKNILSDSLSPPTGTDLLPCHKRAKDKRELSDGYML